MRRKAWAVTAALGAVLLAVTVTFPVTTASAAPPIPLPSPSPGTASCTVDEKLGGITGLAVTSTGYAVTVKAGSGLPVKVYQLDNACKLRPGKALAYGTNGGAHDPQDIQVAADGTLWVADTGDNVTNPTRTTTAVWKFAPDSRATLYRFSYPVKAQAAQALLINGDGNPIIITDNPNGPAGIYVPAAALDPTGRVVQLKHVGDFTPQVTGTENKLGPIGMARVTGAANSHDGKHVAIRTFSDAYEWAVTNGNVVAALTTGTPKITPLPNEPQGTALAYSRDGASFLTVSDVAVGTQTPMLKYQVSPPAVAATKAPAAPAITGKGDTRSWFSKLNLQDLLRIVGGIGVVGLLMVVGGIVGIRRARRRARLAAVNARRQQSPPPDEADLVNQSTAALAQVSGGRRADRYENDRYDTDRHDDTDRYDASLQHPPADRPPASIPEPPFGGGGGGSGYPDPGYGYPPPDEPDRYASPPRPTAGPPSPGPRGDRGVARSHRPSGRRGPRDNGDQARGGGYSDQHDGFGDILD